MGTVNYRKKRKSGKGGIIVILTIVIVSLGIALLLGVRNIRVENNERYSDLELIELSGLKTGGNLIFTKTTAAKDAIAALPFVKSAAVTRVFPDTLVISVVERVPIAFFELEGEYYVVDAEGIVVEKTSAAPLDMPRISGAEVKPVEIGEAFTLNGEHPSERNDAVLEVLTAIAETGLTEKISDVNVKMMANIVLSVRRGPTGSIESSLNAARKLAKLSSAILSYEAGDSESFARFHITDDVVFSTIP